MPKTIPNLQPDHLQPDAAAAGGKISPAVPTPAVPPQADEAFPPLMTSLDTFVKNGSDHAFRELMFELIALCNQTQLLIDRFARHIGTSSVQFHVIMALAQTPDQTVNEIAERMNVTAPAVTIEIGSLVRKGLIERRPNETNRRSSYLTLTPKGQDAVRQVAPLLRRAHDLQFRALTVQQAAVLRESLHMIVADGRRVIDELDAPGAGRAMARGES
jgi:DNA-binding MarR family transcriptional regulator